MRHEEHEDVAVSITGCQGNPHFTIRWHRSDDVDLLTQRFFWRCVKHSPPFPTSLAEISFWNPTLIYIDDSFRRLIHLEHLLCVEVSQRFVALRITSEGNTLDFPVWEPKFALQHAKNLEGGNFKASWLFDKILDLLGRPNWKPLTNHSADNRDNGCLFVWPLQLLRSALHNGWFWTLECRW